MSTFEGVFTPSILTILGVIMYLRFGWVVGNVGLFNTLLIVTLATTITFLTGLSISAIATDRVVRVGGAYYMISRSLGIETGGAVGIPLYFAQALSVALYTIGFSESLVETFPALNLKGVAIISTVGVAILALTSAKIAIRAQYVIMAAIALSLVCFMLGYPVSSEPLGLKLPPPSTESFWSVFAVFFPAVTGIMAGVGMSGDLRNPSRAIPMGTLAAILTGYIIYMLLPSFLAFRADSETLITQPLVMQQISIWGPAILLGVWGATLSSAIGSILGAPRVMQALAQDGILPDWLRWLGKGSGPDNEPRLATVVTLGIALVAIIAGELNQIAPVLTMFFLTTYLVLNMTAGIEGFLQSPSFRPAFKVHWALSLLGAIGCLAVMFLINAVATVIAAVVVLAIYLWLERRELQGAWGDIRRGLWMAIARTAIFQISHSEPDAKNWRPYLLVLSGAPTRRWNLIEFAADLSHNRSLVTIASILPEQSYDGARQNALESTIQDYLEKRGIQAVVRLMRATNPFRGAVQLVEAYGIGSLIPNTVLLGASEDHQRRDEYCEMIAQIHQAQRSVLILRDEQGQGFGNHRRIDVWWGGVQANGSLMLLLAYLLRTSQNWRNATIRLKLVVTNESAVQATLMNLKTMVQEFRIGAVPEVLVSGDRPFADILHESSQDADLVCLGMATPGENFTQYYENLQRMARDLPPTVFVLAAKDMPFSDVLADSR
ncbi:MAG: Na-K-Cl cotransporter [Synechococcales cyanobacterium T60_A2020_003]|nr:Na-K-Cl cotransporter [Synechococcales cyanobacterium T60_A2020_003]